MHFLRRADKRSKALHFVFTGLLALGLSLSMVACDSGGANGEGEDNGDGEDPDPVVPASPSGLEATSGNSEVGLSWEAAEDAESYTVYRATSSGVDASGDPLAEGLSETSYTDTEVENGTTYYYVVTAVAEEEGDASSEVEVTPFDEPPSRPES